VVSDLTVREGATVMAGAPLLTLNGLDTVWMNAAVTEADSGRVAAEAKVTATLAAFPGETFDGKVETLLPEVDAMTRTQKARIVLSNPQHRLAPGMFASVEIVPPASSTQAIVIPSEAVIETGTRNVVIVDAGAGKFRAQEVRIGAQSGGKTEIIDGIREGETVVLSGQFLIDSEASLSGTLARLENSRTVSDSAAPKSDAANAPQQHLATGKVERIDGHLWEIATDAVPSLDMGAMTMTFICPQTMPTADIKPGQHVSFSFFRNDTGAFEISKIVVLDDVHATQKEQRP
jgi:Cu(I)/Ag(I) efflux system membrane fusion protein